MRLRQDRVDHAPNLKVRVRESTSINLHHVSIQTLLIGRERVPRRNLARAFGQQCVSWNDPLLLLASESFFTDFVPTFLELTFILSHPASL